jgi:hypothetical protein
VTRAIPSRVIHSLDDIIRTNCGSMPNQWPKWSAVSPVTARFPLMI